MNTSRRDFLFQLGITSSVLTVPMWFSNCKSSIQPAFSFGIMADPHADLIPDKNERLARFIEKAIDKNVDFIIQLGDFCFPKKENLDFINIWNQFQGPKYHVLGNHDMDICSKAEIMDFLEISENYYALDYNGVHFIVLDANFLYTDHEYLDYDNANFYVDDALRTYIPPDQIEWLKQDLRKTNFPTIIFSHQSLINPLWGIKNRVEIQTILEKENQRAGFQKVIACFNGHDHIDFHRQLNGIHYFEINSMSYQWIGEKFSNKSRYAAELYEQYPHLDKIAPYKDALFTFVELDFGNNQLKLDGLQSDWLSPSPADLKMPPQVFGAQATPLIVDRIVKI